ncbi:hypothetical protein AB833_22515 [Chromatiales bacterium (ex Bugula neritina AB1)]|nr:hypothetical protein AB833_22515 [Chromatiales bacterium (ex Bugula neritina AB1)]
MLNASAIASKIPNTPCNSSSLGLGRLIILGTLLSSVVACAGINTSFLAKPIAEEPQALPTLSIAKDIDMVRLSGKLGTAGEIADIYERAAAIYGAHVIINELQLDESLPPAGWIDQVLYSAGSITHIDEFSLTASDGHLLVAGKVESPEVAETVSEFLSSAAGKSLSVSSDLSYPQIEEALIASSSPQHESTHSAAIPESVELAVAETSSEPPEVEFTVETTVIEPVIQPVDTSVEPVAQLAGPNAESAIQLSEPAVESVTGTPVAALFKSSTAVVSDNALPRASDAPEENAEEQLIAVTLPNNPTGSDSVIFESETPAAKINLPESAIAETLATQTQVAEPLIGTPVAALFKGSGKTMVSSDALVPAEEKITETVMVEAGESIAGVKVDIPENVAAGSIKNSPLLKDEPEQPAAAVKVATPATSLVVPQPGTPEKKIIGTPVSELGASAGKRPAPAAFGQPAENSGLLDDAPVPRLAAARTPASQNELMTDDADGDGVTDSYDECASRPGYPVNAKGCQVLDGYLKNVRFYGKTDKLTRRAMQSLDNVATVMQQHPQSKIAILSYTSNSGSPWELRGQARERARSVVGYLVNQGVEKDRLQAYAFGHMNGSGDQILIKEVD